jgi:hypothetical protein
MRCRLAQRTWQVYRGECEQRLRDSESAGSVWDPGPTPDELEGSGTPQLRTIAGTERAHLPCNLFLLFRPGRDVRMVAYTAISNTRSLLRPACFAFLRFSSSHAAAAAASVSLPSHNHTHLAANPAVIPNAPSALAAAGSPSQERFDWRLRASSRRKPVAPEQVEGKRKYVKRVIPQEHDLQLGEPFYEETQAYRSQYVYCHTSVYLY